MKTFIKILILTFIFANALSAQTKKLSTKPTNESLLKYCGEYIPSVNDTMLTPMSIILKGNELFRRLSGDIDQVLIQETDTKFTYADESGRSIIFTLNEKRKALHLLLSRPDGVFFLQKIK